MSKHTQLKLVQIILEFLKGKGNKVVDDQLKYALFCQKNRNSFFQLRSIQGGHN